MPLYLVWKIAKIVWKVITVLKISHPMRASRAQKGTTVQMERKLPTKIPVNLALLTIVFAERRWKTVVIARPAIIVLNGVRH